MKPLSPIVTICVFALGLALPADAQSPKLMDYNHTIAPHIIAGGEWKSDVVLTNHASTARPVAFVGFKQDGSRWEWDLPHFQNEVVGGGIQTLTYYRTTLGAGETRVIHFERAGDAEYGWAAFISCFSVEACGDVSGYVLLRNHNPARQQDFELSYPFTDRFGTEHSMLFDQGNWGQMVLNLTNAADTVIWETATTVEVVVYNEAGSELFRKDYDLPKSGTKIVNMAHETEALWHVRGRVNVRVKSGNAPLLLTGIRINETGSFTPVQSMAYR
ncbi:MAG: hypothetical protein LC114_24285 [Bryobacterales bacterium]|nr:hypothetical protein [Bryobacterales bacterium]